MYSAARSVGLAAVGTLVVCALALAVPGCGGTNPTTSQTIERYAEELREAISSNVLAEGRKTQMLKVVDQVQALQLRFSQETMDFVENYRKLNAEYDATRPAFDQMFADYNAKRIKARSEALDLHFQLASLATADEWKAVGKAEAKMYEEANEARQSQENAK
jgi:hypothetical protein